MIRATRTGAQDIVADLSWMDILRGIAIIGVFLDNWNGYIGFEPNLPLVNAVALTLVSVAGPFVQVFFILSGFGLMMGYLRARGKWSWARWGCRRVTKIVIPYILAVILSFALGMLGSRWYSTVNMQFSGKSLLAYLTFTRNFYVPSWPWNPPMWFMPVIIGLYLSFPILIKILERWGMNRLLLVSILVTYGTITVAVAAGWHGMGHGADLFTFWMVQFALGMLLAYLGSSQPEVLSNLIGLRAFLLGVGLYAFSWALRTYVPLGKAYNDAFTSIGIFLILLNVCWVIRSQFSAAGRALSQLGSESYIMYLVHFPIMAFLIGPLLKTPNNAVIMIALGGVYLVGIFFLSRFISPPINRLTSWSYRLFYPPYRRDVDGPLGSGERVVAGNPGGSSPPPK